MAIQWTIVCLQDAAPVISGASLDCSNGSLQVVPFRYLSEDEASLGSLLSLSSSDAAAISAAILGVWSIAWGFKMAIRTLGSSKDVQEND